MTPYLNRLLFFWWAAGPFLAIILWSSGFYQGVNYEGNFVPTRSFYTETNGAPGEAAQCVAVDVNTGDLTAPWPPDAHGRCYLKDHTFAHVKASLRAMLRGLP